MLNVIFALFILANYEAGAATETKLGSGHDTTSEFAINAACVAWIWLRFQRRRRTQPLVISPVLNKTLRVPMFLSTHGH